MSVAAVEVLPTSDYRGSWTIQVTGAWAASATNFTDPGPGVHPDFPLTPDGTPKVVLTVQSPGYTRSGGQAVATTQTRTIVATKPIRRPYTDGVDNGSGSTPNFPLLQEQDIGGGQRRVWLALSEPIFVGETVTASFATGWRTGQAAASGVAVTNNSDRAVPLPIARWAQPQMMPCIGTSSHRAEMIIASHFPRHFGAVANQAVAGVMFEATDGTTWTAPQWVTEDSLSTLFGDNLLCWGRLVDFTGLNPGWVQVRATIYPWIGAPRVIGSTLLNTFIGVHGVQADIPLVFGYDPTDTLFGRRYVAVDAATGSTDPLVVTVATSVAAAKGGTRAASLSVSNQAMRTTAVSFPPNNGFPTYTRATSYWEAILMAGSQQIGTFSVSLAGMAEMGWLVVRGDPDDPNPRQNCRLQSPTATAPPMRNPHYSYRDCRLEMGDFTLPGARVWVDNATLVQRAGAAAQSQYFATSAPAAGSGNLFMTRFNNVAYGPATGSNIRPILLRNGVAPSARSASGTSAKVFINMEFVRDPRINYAGVSSAVEFEFWDVSGSQTTDCMAWNIRSLWNSGRAPSLSASSIDADGFVVIERTALVNMMIARAHTDTDFKHIQIGENSNSRQLDCIYDGLTMVGQRTNFHNDPPIATNNLRQRTWMRNCYFDRFSSKSDTFATASGNRTGTWPIHYGVGFTNNMIGERSSIGAQFQYEYYGRAAIRVVPLPGPGTVSEARFADDQCNWGPNAANPGINGVGAGGGDYRPGAGSPLLRAAVAGNTDRDIDGTARGLAFAIGGLNGAAEVASSVLAPAAAFHATSGTEAVLEPPAGLQPGNARHAIRDVEPVLVPAAAPPVVAGAPLRVLRVRSEERTYRANAQ